MPGASGSWEEDDPAITRLQAETAADLTQLGLSVTGIFDPTPISDGSNAAISLGRAGIAVKEGSYWSAAGYTLDSLLNAASAFPYVGDALAKPFEMARTSTRLGRRIEELGALAEKGSTKAVDLLKALKNNICGKPGMQAVCEKLVAAIEKGAAKGKTEAAEKTAAQVEKAEAKGEAEAVEDGLHASGSKTEGADASGTTADPKPYSNPDNRPKYGDGQVEEVWENAKQPSDGKVYDPNTEEELFWDKTKPRNGQWDMGHLPDEKYEYLHRDYMDGKISKEEFLRRYRDPANYRPEAPSANRSHRYE